MKRIGFIAVLLFFAVGAFADIQGLSGGLVVCLGTDAAEQVSNGWKTESFVFQCLENDPAKISSLREKAQAAGVHGRLTVRQWNGGKLPYVDGLVNLLIVGSSEVTQSEISRVMALGGVVVIDGKRIVKPWPKDVDDWTHFLHSAGNNAVADDKKVGPPRTLRWDCGPMYCRSHELDISVAAVVVEGGKLISIIDKGPAGTIGKKTPDKWVLEARDAFNGIQLWERPVPNWSWRVWKPELTKTDEWKLIAQRRLVPATLPRRLVAVDGKVYVTIGVGAPVSVVDATTGKTIREIEGSGGVDEIILKDGVLVMVKRPEMRETAITNPPSDPTKLITKKAMPVKEDGFVLAVDAATGKALWKADAKTVIPYTLAAENGRVFFHTGSELVSLDLKSGKQSWRIDNSNTDANRWDSRHILVAYKDVVLLSVPKKLCEAFDAKTGKTLWSGKGGRGSAFNTTPMDMFVIDDLMWFTDGKQYNGKDLYTGEVKKTIDLPTYFLSPGHHLRCYRAKATTRYILDNKRGIEFMDMKGENHQKNDWVRGACRYGIIPANGLIYSTPTPCNCYQAVQLKGYNALSDALPPKPEGNVLEKGAAFGKGQGKPAVNTDWPTLRRNVAREGSVASGATPALKRSWSKKLGGKLTQPIVVGDRLYVVSRANATLFALDAKTGAVVWNRALPADVDSPPAYWKGQLVMGCRDGWVYNLRASDGELAWRFRAAPTDRQICSYGKLESSWPVHGNVLVVDPSDGSGQATAYVAAGRNTYLDGGIYLYGLDAATGAVRCKQHLANPVMDNEKPYDPHHLRGAMTDVMVFDGKTISMQSQTFDLQLNIVDKPDSPHLYATGGFLDGETWHRNIWLYTKGWTLMNKNASTFPNAGQMLVHEGDRTYGVKYFTKQTGQSMVFYPEEDGYNLYCDRDSESWDILLKDYLDEKEASTGKKKKNKQITTRKKAGKNAEDDISIWSTWIPLRVRAMVKAGDTLFVSGAPDKIPEVDPLAPFEGRGKGILQAVSPDTGKQIKEVALDAPPIFDGLISANGKVFMSLENGAVECW